MKIPKFQIVYPKFQSASNLQVVRFDMILAGTLMTIVKRMHYGGEATLYISRAESLTNSLVFLNAV